MTSFRVRVPGRPTPADLRSGEAVPGDAAAEADTELCGAASVGPKPDETASGADRAAVAPAGRAEGADAESGRAASIAGLAVWVGIVAAIFGVGALLRRAGKLPVDPVGPLHASARLIISPLAAAAVVGLVAVVVLPVAARRLPWHALLGTAWLASVAWAVALQLPDGIARPLTAPTEYLAGLPAMGDDPLGWLRGFTRHIQEYPTHVKGHPPLPMMILWTMQWIGLEGAGWAAALVIVAGGSATAAIAITLRTLTSEKIARRAIPYMALAPTAIWVATSMDALFLGIASWATTCTTLAFTSGGRDGARPPRGTIPIPSSRSVDGGGNGFHKLWITLALSAARASADRVAGGISTGRLPLLAAFVGGLLFGSLPYLSYGLLSFGTLPLAVLLLTRPRRTVVGALIVGCLVVPVAATVAGFSWWDGMVETHAAWAAGAGSQRPYAFFFVGDLGVLALVLGPAAAVGVPIALSRVRGRGTSVNTGRSRQDHPDGRSPGQDRAVDTRVPAGDSRENLSEDGVDALNVTSAANVMTTMHATNVRIAEDAAKPTAATSTTTAENSKNAAGLAPTGRLGLLVGAAFAGVLALDLSGVTRGEVERIWLPYAVWMAAAGAVYKTPARGLLLAQVATALLIQALVRSPW